MRLFAALAAAVVLAPAGLRAQVIVPAVSPLPPPATLQSPAPDPQSRTGRPVFRSGASLVSLNVTVMDGVRYVSGLQSHDFVVYEDGVKQDVQFFESRSVPVDLILLIDTSSSMSDKIDVVHEAATGFLKALRPGDRGALVTFSDTVSVVLPLTPDRDALERAVRGISVRGATALYNAVYVSLKQFGQAAHGAGDVRRQAIVVLSDGEDNRSLISLDDVMTLAHRMGVNIYAVSLRPKLTSQGLPEQGGHRSLSAADDAMETMARETGAQAFFPAPAQLKRVYANIANELATQYSIGYEPVNSRPDGHFRHVIVQIITHPGLHPRTRPGYTAEERQIPASRRP